MWFNECAENTARSCTHLWQSTVGIGMKNPFTGSYSQRQSRLAPSQSNTSRSLLLQKSNMCIFYAHHISDATPVKHLREWSMDHIEHHNTQTSPPTARNNGSPYFLDFGCVRRGRFLADLAKFFKSGHSESTKREIS